MWRKVYIILVMIAAFLGTHLGCEDMPEEGSFTTIEVPQQAEVGLAEPVELFPLDLPEGMTRLRLGVTPALGIDVAQKSNAPLGSYLSDVLRIPVDIVVADSYDQLTTLIANEEVELALLPPLSYVKAKEEVEDLVPVVGKIGRGASHYSSYVLVRAEGSLQNLKDLKGKRLAFVDPTSSSGFLLPYDYLMRNGIDPEDDLKSMTFAGSHAAALRMLALGQVDAAASGSGIREILKSELQDVDGAGDTRLRILANAGPIPYGAVCARSGFPEAGIRKVRRAFLQLNTMSPQGRTIWRASGDITGWMLPNDLVYAGLRRKLSRVRKWRSESKGERVSQ